jgi:predicted kinase
MFNVCPQCGTYSDEKVIDPGGPFAICPACAYAHPFRRLPLFVLSGASGSGKSTIALALVPILQDCVVLESDLLWRPEFATPQDDYRTYRNLWLRVAKNVSQGGRPVVLAGSAVPEQFEACAERRYFSALHYLALVCEDELLEARLRARPTWRHSGTPEVLTEMLSFNRWLRAQAATTTPPMALLDTSHMPVAESVAQTIAWIRGQESARVAPQMRAPA